MGDGRGALADAQRQDRVRPDDDDPLAHEEGADQGQRRQDVRQPSVWVKTNGVAGAARLMLTFYDASGTYLGVTVQSPGVSGTSDWTKVGLTTVAPANTAYLRIELRQSNTGTSWWDDVSLVSPS